MKDNREKIVVRTSIISIVSNIILAGFKAFIGFLANSIAIISDAVNNLSDALSSIITIVGTKLAGKAPDKKHPYGYGRIEYMTSLIVSAIVLYAGITALVESIKKIIHPETKDVIVDKIDKTNPRIDIKTDAKVWSNQDVTIKANVNENGCTIQYQIDNGSWQQYSKNVVVSENCTINLLHRVFVP